MMPIILLKNVKDKIKHKIKHGFLSLLWFIITSLCFLRLPLERPVGLNAAWLFIWGQLINAIYNLRLQLI